MRKTVLFITGLAFTISMFSQKKIAEAPQAATPGTLSISATTSPNTGQYDQSHILAIWVQTSTGTFTKTLMSYANIRVNELTSWVANSAKNKVDAVTGATLNSHATRTASWNGKNVSQVVVEDGDYNVKFELADGGASKTVTYKFTKGTATSTGTIVGSAVSCFSNISVTWIPSNTSIDEVELSNLYSLYPNPCSSSVYVNGPDIKSIEIYNLTGKKIYSTDQLKVNLSTLQKGDYMLNIITSRGIISKKLIKN